MDFPRAWEISKSVAPDDHHPDCSTAQTEGAILCDCEVLITHPDHVKDYGETLTWEPTGSWIKGTWEKCVQNDVNN